MDADGRYCDLRPHAYWKGQFESVLIDAVLQGDEAAFQVWFADYANIKLQRSFRFLYKNLFDEDDIIQDTVERFVQKYLKPRAFKDRALHALLKTIMRNRVIDLLAKRADDLHIPFDPEIHEPEPEGRDILDRGLLVGLTEPERFAYEKELQAVLSTLPKDWILVAVLRRGGAPLRVIAAATGYSIAKVHRILRQIAALLD